MKKVFVVIALLFVLTLTACGASAEPTAIPTVSLDGGAVAPQAQQSSSGSVSASAVVAPLQEARLSFASVARVTGVNVEVGDKVKAGDTLIVLDTAFLEAKLREAEANLQTAEIQLSYLKRVGTGAKHLELAEVDVKRAQALVDSARATLQAQSGLIAPFDGTIVAVDVVASEAVLPGREVIVLGDLSKYLIETTDLSERNVPRVKIGQKANVFIDALNETFTGKVVAIDNVSSTLGGDVVYKVTIDLDKQPDGFLWGMSADVEILVEE